MFVTPFRLSPLHTAERSLDAEHFERIANDPSVRSLLGGDGPIVLGPTEQTPNGIVTDTQNFCFKTPNGAFLLWAIGAGRYDVHSLFLPDGRGVEAAQAMGEVAAYMFTHTDCLEGRTTVPAGNAAAGALALRGGFERRFKLEHMPWRNDGTTVQASFLSLTLEKWALTDVGNEVAGHWFHEALERAKQKAGSTRPVHADEPVHDYMAGAAIRMILGGQVDKAINFYNAWAMTAHYATIRLLSKKPVVIDVVDAVIEARPGGMVILTCR